MLCRFEEQSMTKNKVSKFLVLVFLVILPGVTAQQRKPQPPKSLRLYGFDCGSLNIPDISPYQLKKEEIATNYMSVPCFLIAHPKERLMWGVAPGPDSAV